MNLPVERLAVPVIFLLLALGLWGMRSSGSEEAVVVAVSAPATAAPSVTDSWASSGRLWSVSEEVTSGEGASGTPSPEVASTPFPRPLSRDDMLIVLRTAGWPDEWLTEALSVACGPALLRDGTVIQSGESGCDPSAVGPSPDRGLFQITPVWHDRCGVDGHELLYPLVNAACALIIVRYSESVGLDRWHYWSTNPIMEAD